MTLWQALDMARKRTKLAVSAAQAAQLKEQIRAVTDPRDKERLQVVQWATSGQHSLAELAQLVGRARSTIQIWLDDFTAGGVARLLERTPPPGKPSLVAGAKVQAELKAGLQAGRWRTAGQVAAWLQETHGIQRAAKSLYYWLGKVGGALRVPRPCHVQQNPAATAASFDAPAVKARSRLSMTGNSSTMNNSFCATARDSLSCRLRFLKFSKSAARRRCESFCSASSLRSASDSE